MCMRAEAPHGGAEASPKNRPMEIQEHSLGQCSCENCATLGTEVKNTSFELWAKQEIEMVPEGGITWTSITTRPMWSAGALGWLADVAGSMWTLGIGSLCGGRAEIP